MGDKITPADDRMAVTPPALQPTGITRSRLAKTTDFLQDSSRIGTLRSHYEKYRRYAQLNSSNIFASLVTLYTQLFITQWQHFRRFIDSMPVPQGTQPWTYVARVYVSCWFYDLYVSNREAVRKLSPLAFSERYFHEIVHISVEYDEYLALLNASIRPTHIKYASEDALFIPLISETYHWQTENPFGIINYVHNLECFYGVLAIMKERKGWNISTISSDTLGRPCWLFDWHDNSNCCAWFPSEGNFTLDDVTLAYIIGDACTPKLGPRDVDDWQPFPGGIQPAVIDINQYRRIVPRRFYGSYEVRTYDLGTFIIGGETPITRETSKKRKSTLTEATPPQMITATGAEPTGSSSSQDQPEMEAPEILPKIQIVDWVYYSRVVLNLELHTRTGALRSIALA